MHVQQTDGSAFTRIALGAECSRNATATKGERSRGALKQYVGKLISNINKIIITTDTEIHVNYLSG